MPRDGSYRLSEYPGDYVELACDKCGRRGRLRKDRLIAEYAVDASLPDLRMKIAQCERARSVIDPCGAYYVDWRRLAGIAWPRNRGYRQALAVRGG